MNNKTIAMVIVAVLAVAAVGVGIYFVYGNEDTPDTMSFLIEDGVNNFFWIEGEGNDGFTAFADACDKNDVLYVNSPSDSMGAFITSISGIEQTEDYSSYWGLFYYSDGEWVSSDVGISSLKSSEVGFVAFVYGAWGVTPSMNPPAVLI